MKFFRPGHLAVLLLPGQRVYQGGGQKRLPRLKPLWPKNGSKRPNSGSIGFGEFFLSFGAENACFGARVIFGTQN